MNWRIKDLDNKKGDPMQIAVIGGCGRLGFRLSLIASNKGHKVQIIDLDEEKINHYLLGWKMNL